MFIIIYNIIYYNNITQESIYIFFWLQLTRHYELQRLYECRIPTGIRRDFLIGSINSMECIEYLNRYCDYTNIKSTKYRVISFSFFNNYKISLHSG